MTFVSTYSSAEVAGLRAEHYNAEVIGVKYCHEDLLLLRVRPDAGVPRMSAGQYAVLGLGSWEPRVVGVQAEPVGKQEPQLIKRAYSISSPILDDRDQLVQLSSAGFLEFYITLVRSADPEHPPALTPRLFTLRVGDRIYCGPRMHGNYTLEGVPCDDHVVMAATGTGEAPHNAMLVELLAAEHRGRIVAVTCVRWKKDLAYLETHRRLQKIYDNYRYLPLTTREPENIIPTLPNYVGKRYLQDYFAAGDFEQDADLELSCTRTHVFLCGSPEMIGVPRHTHNMADRYPQPVGMVEVLERKGFRIDQPHEPGNVHFEKYW